MKNKKEGLFIQCIVCSLLPLITLFIPYLKFGMYCMFTVAADYIIYSLFKVWYFCAITWKSHGKTDRNGFTKSYGKCK